MPDCQIVRSQNVGTVFIRLAESTLYKYRARVKREVNSLKDCL